MQLKSKTALITGAARGIGQAIALELAQAGANIIGVDLHEQDLRETGNRVQTLGRSFHAFACDVSDDSAVKRMLSEVENKLEGFDILVNNAGILPSGPFLEREFSVWRKTLEVNLLGLMFLTHAALPRLLQRKQAHIVNIASIAGKFGTEGVVAYAASKHGVVGFSSALREELRDTNVGVSWICPSLADTRLAAGVDYTFLTPKIQPRTIARSVRSAIERNAAEVFVPRRVRWVVSVLPAVTPRLSRSILKWSKASQGWVDARKEVAA